MDPNRADSKQIQDEERELVLSEFGLAGARPLAIGTEAEVYLKDDHSLLKLYADSSRLGHLQTLGHLYESIDSADVGFRLPAIREIVPYGSLIAVIEERLHGEPLADLLPNLQSDDLDRAEELYVDAVWKLKEIVLRTPPETYMLFDDDQVSLVARESFEAFYARMLDLKLARVSRYFQLSYPRFSADSSQLVNAIRTQRASQPALVHGDFFPGNLLVDAPVSQVQGVIDFGSFTMFGDHLLDVAGAFGFYEMYHPDRALIRERLLSRILPRLSEQERPIFFRFLLANAIVTSDLYASDSNPVNDDHFRWATEIVCEPHYWDEALS